MKRYLVAVREYAPSYWSAETCQFHRLDAANYIDAECEAVARFGHDPVEITLENDDA